MAEFCVDCFNKMMGITDSARKYHISKELDLCEECGELIQAAIKAHEIGADITTDFVGELADVYVLIRQFLATMPTVWRTEFDTMVNFKLRRQIERIESENP